MPLQTVLTDAQASAKAIRLIYVTDSQEGIRRERKGKSFRYMYKGKPVRNKDDLERIKCLVIPPAWENVWICSLANGHLQATGLDARQRKQYKYHALWNQHRNETKFYRMFQFGEALPAIRKQVEKDISYSGMPKEKVLATIVRLMEHTSIRVGSDFYEKNYGSVGLTTLKNKHVNINGANLKFSFRGKKGVEHDISINNRRLAHIVKQCRDIPGKELFQYYDEEGNKHSIDSGMVNDYIKNIVDGEFTSKDFRTWTGTVQALLAFKESGPFESESEAKKNIVSVLDKVSKYLGNTRTVCRKYYVHPAIIEMYETAHLHKYLQTLSGNGHRPQTGLMLEEKVLMKILKKIKKPVVTVKTKPATALNQST